MWIYKSAASYTNSPMGIMELENTFYVFKDLENIVVEKFIQGYQREPRE